MARTIIALAAALTLVAVLPAVPAQAQAPRTFVSAAGNDSNPCSFAAPCRHFQAAVNATSAGGEVDALDPAGYGPITIGQAITIEGQGWSYIAPPVGGNGITINSVSGNVAIHGVSLNGVGITGGTKGIIFNSGGSLTVADSVIRNFTQDAILFAPNASSLNRIVVSNTLVSDNNGGIGIFPTGSGPTNGFIDHVKIENTAGNALAFGTSTQTINVTVNDTVIANNSDAAVFSLSSGGAINVMVRNSILANNSDTGLAASGIGSAISVTRSTITGNGFGWLDVGGGTVTSYGDNNIDGNANGNTEPPNPLTYK